MAQMKFLKHGPEILIGTPGRVIDLLDRRIIFGHAVAAHDQKVFFAKTAFAHDAMNEQTSIASVECKITRLCLFKIIRLNGSAIARPQGRQHADSAGTQSQHSHALQHLCRQTAFERFLQWGNHGRG